MSYLSYENDEDTATAVEREGDGDEGNNSAPPTHRLVANGGVGVSNLGKEAMKGITCTKRWTSYDIFKPPQI